MGTCVGLGVSTSDSGAPMTLIPFRAATPLTYVGSPLTHSLIDVILSSSLPHRYANPTQILLSSTALSMAARHSPRIFPLSSWCPTRQPSAFFSGPSGITNPCPRRRAEYISRRSLHISPSYAFFSSLSTASYPCHVGNSQNMTLLSLSLAAPAL